MRIGINPQKNKSEIGHDFFHQIVVPVYIPHHKDYFEHSYSILKLCLNSLFLTSHNKTYFTIVNNGCDKVVVHYLNNLLEEGKIHELVHTHNVGKINAVFKGLSGHQFPLVTISDSDVLFLHGWQQATYDLFEEFPKTGFVSTTPNPKLVKYHTQNIIWTYLFSKKLRFVQPKDSKALSYFAKSIGNPEHFSKIHREQMLTLHGTKANAILGSGHFVATYRGDVFSELEERYTSQKLGAQSVRKFLDQPVADKGYWRLATAENFTYHMGNVEESWMKDTLESLENNSAPQLNKPILALGRRPNIWIAFQKFLVDKFIYKGVVWRSYLRAKGLSKEGAKDY